MNMHPAISRITYLYLLSSLGPSAHYDISSTVAWLKGKGTSWNIRPVFSMPPPRQVSILEYTITWPINSLVTKDMIPQEWRFTDEQEKEWEAHMATMMPNREEVKRAVAIELPDFPVSHGYQEASCLASLERDDIVSTCITAMDQWKDRKVEMHRILQCLLTGSPPSIVFIAITV